MTIFDESFDVAIVGGGVNGCGIARDAAGRGLKVLLCEKADLASATSSASSKLIHGGLRYLEQYHFRLVREALAERLVLLRMAPHIVWPLEFVLPHDSHLRPVWMIRLGLFLYDRLGGPGTVGRHGLRRSGLVPLGASPEGVPLARAGTAFGYADCWVEDARLVALNAVDARERGATVLTRTEVTGATREAGHWRVDLDLPDGAKRSARARILVNAAGPWVARMLDRVPDIGAHAGMRLIKGSHMVVPRLYDGAHAYILQNDDGRIVFVIPYERRFTLIGTTDVPFDGDPRTAKLEADETAYLCAAVGRWFDKPPTPADVVWSYAGVRPLYDDGKADAKSVTRDYVLELDAPAGKAPLLSVFGGKLTTYRRLAEHALRKLEPWIAGATCGAWTATSALPGGDLGTDFEPWLADLAARHPWLPPDLARRLGRAYGTRVERLLGDATGLADLGEDFGAGLTRREVDHLIAEEWAVGAEDILWRRSKLGLHMPDGGAARLAEAIGA
jgi:glycerol-3-phosphate dehydrogenase